MDRSNHLAKLLGPTLMVLGLGLLVRSTELLSIFEDVVSSPTLIFVMCVLGLLGGIALILAHNIWVMDWRLIITVLGWLSAIESAVWLIVPHTVLKPIVLSLIGSTMLLAYGLFVLLLGGILSTFGYLAPRHVPGQSGRPQ